MKKTIFSGIQPTGIPTLGSYCGAIKNWKELADSYDTLYCVVDMHSITVRQNPEELQLRSREMIGWLVVLGLDPNDNILYLQSHVPQHAELAWILNCYTYMGELGRMTQFKDKSQKNAENINAGLFTYPVLMAADILLYNTNLVPIGDDQRQHLELARDVAVRFNGIYGDIFTVPEGYFPKIGARIMGLQDPTSKMSKSEENAWDTIFLTDEPDLIIKKFKRAVTDSGSEIKFAPDKPGISNLLSIYSCAINKAIPECESEFDGKGYGYFKQAVGEAVVDLFKPLREEHKKVMADTGYINKIINDGAEKASKKATNILQTVKKVIGLG